MHPRTDSHDKLPHRLSKIFARLHQGETLDPPQLAQDFRVSVRTAQRDLIERFAFLGLERVEGGYRLDPRYLGQIHGSDMERFACLAGIQGLYPALTCGFLRELLDSRVGSRPCS